MKKLFTIINLSLSLSLLSFLPVSVFAKSGIFKLYCSPQYNKSCANGSYTRPTTTPSVQNTPVQVAVTSPQPALAPTPAPIPATSKNKAQNNFADRLLGRIVLRVEKNGEAYYVNPVTRSLDSLGNPKDAFRVMREAGTGASTSALKNVPIGLLAHSEADQDNDGLVDIFEIAIGTNPQSADTDNDGYTDWQEILSGYSPTEAGKRQPVDIDTASKLSGRIFLQVQDHGEAWYIYPGDKKRYYLARPSDAFAIMRVLGIGISEKDYETLLGDIKSS